MTVRVANGKRTDTISWHNSDTASLIKVHPMFIYVIFSGNAPMPRSKIGISLNPHARAQDISAGSPWTVRLIKAWEVPADQARSIEKEVHESLKDKRVRGEWFRVTTGTAMQAVLTVLFRRGILRWPSQIEREAREAAGSQQ
jgi:hypothetical protein